VGDISAGSGTITGNLDVTSDLSVAALFSTANLQTSSDASFGNNVNINGRLGVGDISADSGTITGNLDVTNDLSVNANIYSVTMHTTGDASFGNDVDVLGNLSVTGSITSAGGTLTLTDLTITNDLSVNNVISTKTLKTSSDVSFGGTLTITETGAGTDASAAGGTITLSHTVGPGKNSIVFKSSSNPDSDFGYIQYEDDGGLDSTSSENGLLTIGIQNDPTKYGATTTDHTDRIKFDIAGASAYLDARANSDGGNIGAAFTTNYVNHVGLRADALRLDISWDQTLTAYNSTNLEGTKRSALYQYFENAHDSDNDMAFTGMDAGSGSTVDGGQIKPYGYMLRTRSDGYIAYRTKWIDGDAIGAGLALGVNALPGRYHDFAVGGRSHFGGDVSFAGNLTVGGAGIFTGESTNYNNTTSPAGIYIGKYVSTVGEHGSMQIVSNNAEKKSLIDFVNTGSSETDYEGRIAYFGNGGSPSKSFVIYPYGESGGTLTLQSLGSSVIKATVQGDLDVTRNADIDGTLGVTGATTLSSTLGVTGATTMSNRLTINEVGSGTPASATAGSIMLTHSSNNGSGKNSIVFKSMTSRDSDYGYIQYADKGVPSNSRDNSRLTLGVQNDTSEADKEEIHFDIAGANAYLQVHAATTKDSKLVIDATEFNGINPDSYSLNSEWDLTLNYYDSTSSDDLARYAMYQYFNNKYSDDYDMACVGYLSGSTNSIDGKQSTGYMYRAKKQPNTFIAFQTQGKDTGNNNTADGLKLGVNSLPGIEYDFAVGGKSHFGNNILVIGDLSAQTVTGGNISITGNTISTTTGDMIIQPTGDFITIKANLTIDGSFNFKGDMIRTDTNVRVTDQLDISNNGTGPALIVTQHGTHPVATFYDDANLALIIKDGGDVSMAYNLRVEGNQSVKGTFDVSGASTFDGTATFSKVTTINANLDALDASFSSRVDIATDLSANNITATNDLHVDGTIYQF
jgi:predicted acyltransferase (DUF342 family)